MVQASAKVEFAGLGGRAPGVPLLPPGSQAQLPQASQGPPHRHQTPPGLQFSFSPQAFAAPPR